MPKYMYQDIPYTFPVNRKQRRKRKRIAIVATILIVCALILGGIKFLGIFAVPVAENNISSSEDDSMMPDPALDVFSQEESSASPAQKEPAFSDYTYFVPEYEERYALYQRDKPEMLLDEVVWRVNAGLDGEFYVDVKDVADPEALYVIVNKYNVSVK
ncbi:MAG: hypothetical protein LBT26_06450 [Clostridiales Family XIII bacterium]|nr:hypothetical protein [Clostridiales Family XIII bacterium]